jgi:hypothetical protein
MASSLALTVRSERNIGMTGAEMAVRATDKVEREINRESFRAAESKAVPPLLLAISRTAVEEEQIRNEKSASILKSNPLSISALVRRPPSTGGNDIRCSDVGETSLVLESF